MKQAVLLVFLIVLLSACTQSSNEVIQMGSLTLTSSSFNQGESIPSKFSCDGNNINPELLISGAPEATVSFALIMDDPDAPAGDWVHWIVWNIPATTTMISENSVPGVVGLNSWNENKYSGPCPPSGTHRYYFKLYALDIEISLSNGAAKPDVEDAMQGHVLAQTSLIGTYTYQ